MAQPHTTSPFNSTPAMGTRFFRLVVLREIPARRSLKYVECHCDCGRLIEIRVAHLYNGHCRSCGCFAAEESARRAEIHGMYLTAEYRAWGNMKARCYNTRNASYARYGGRGIAVCERWQHSFERFLDDMGPRPSSAHSLDRFPDNNGNYEPGNCRWATKAEQANNLSSNRTITLDGVTRTAAEWASMTGLAPSVIYKRAKRSLSASQILDPKLKRVLRR